MNTQILSLWKDPAVGLTGLSRFHAKLKKKGICVSRNKLKALLRTQLEHELFRQPRKTLGNSITETGVGVGIQADLADMSLISRRNSGYRWILTVVDVYSRRAWALPIKRKTGPLVRDALQIVFNEHKPERLTTDSGPEFLNVHVQKLLQENHIEHFTGQPGDKQVTGIVERFNRTLRDLMGRNFERIGKLHWVTDLSSLVRNYNTSLHRSIQDTPMNVWKGALPYHVVHREEFPFHEGETVRLLIKRNLFEKRAGAQKWSKELFTIVRREGFKYIVQNQRDSELKTKYRPSELMLADIEASTVSLSSSSHVNISHLHQTARDEQRTQRWLRQEGIDSQNVRRTRLRSSVRQRNVRNVLNTKK
jgi:transposase InsO family protein